MPFYERLVVNFKYEVSDRVVVLNEISPPNFIFSYLKTYLRVQILLPRLYSTHIYIQMYLNCRLIISGPKLYSQIFIAMFESQQFLYPVITTNKENRPRHNELASLRAKSNSS